MTLRLSLLCFLLTLTTVAFARSARMQWSPIPEAASYEVRVWLSRSKSRLFPTKVPSLKIDLPVGAYRYEVRAIDSVERPGSWTPKQDLYVQAIPDSPRLSSPIGNARVEFEETYQVSFSWAKVEQAKKYRFTLFRNGARFQHRETQEEGVVIDIQDPGRYEWSVVALEPAVTAMGKVQEDWLESRPSETRVFTAHSKKRRISSVAAVSTDIYRRSSFNAYYHAALYNYQVTTVGASTPGEIQSTLASTVGVGQEAWLTPSFGIFAKGSATFFQVDSFTPTLFDFQAAPAYRFRVGGAGDLVLSLGLRVREYFRMVPPPTGSTDAPEHGEFFGLGPTLGLDYRYPISGSIVLRGKAQLYSPLVMLGGELGGHFSGSALSSMNYDVGAEVIVGLSSNLAMGAALGYDSRTINLVHTDGAASDKIQYSAGTFQASVYYLFGP